MRKLCAALGIDPADVLAFGDNYNDVSMLDTVGAPCIMDSAAPELRARLTPAHAARPEDVLAALLRTGALPPQDPAGFCL